jgi:hypothetical protein
MPSTVSGAPWLRYVDPRRADLERLGDPLKHPGAWWVAFVEILTSPRTATEARAKALRAAAERTEAVEVTGLIADLTGRWGVSVRVPYLAGGEAVTADLMFDPGTGALLQVAAHTSAGVLATTYLAVGGR